MRVRFDEQIFAIQEFGGISRMFASLARAFIRNPELGVDVQPFRLPVVNRYLLDDTITTEALGIRRARSWQAALGKYLVQPPSSNGVDVEHSTFYLPHGRPGKRAAVSVVTVHDLIPELLPNTRRRLDLLTIKKHYIARADHVVCVSEATRQDLVRVYPDAADKAYVIHHGVDDTFRPALDTPRPIAGPYLLFVGNRDQYKDGALAIKAFQALSESDRDLHLLFVGGGPLRKQELSQVPISVRARIHQRSIGDADMPAVYSHAQVLIFPSHFEGFGMPIVEAMACGLPVVAARASSLPEVGGEACLYFTPGHLEDFVETIRIAVNDPSRRESMTQAGLERAATFTWKGAAQAYARVYRA